jgi:hypothetical protein
MSPALEAGLRSLGAAVLGAVLIWAANSANLTPVISAPIALLIAALAGALDKAYSPNGTVVFGTVGTAR